MDHRLLVARQAGAMSLMHCPLCIGLALLSVVRAASHLLLVGLRLAPGPAV
ncbi:MAG: hypothetical protein ACO3ZD_06445 [Cyanobium sp.]